MLASEPEAQSLRRKMQTNAESNAQNRAVSGTGLTEKQCRTNKIAAAPLSLEAWVR
jgi:hypothetical protein